MGTTDIALILALEALALALLLVTVVFIKFRKTNRRLKQSQDKIKSLTAQLASAQAEPPEQPSEEPSAKSYADKLNHQIELTKQYHSSLGSKQDISLDLDPEAPAPRRAAALRHSLLVAELAAAAPDEEEIKWDFLANRYQQIFAFNKDFAPSPDDELQKELDTVTEELNQALKRIDNLERFKDLYLELEDRWEKCRGEASEHYSELKSMVSKTPESEDINEVLDRYHQVYSDVDIIFEGKEQDFEAPQDQPHLVEIQRLREVAAEQHRIINELKIKLAEIDTPEEQAEIVAELANELDRQSRFLKESETCIQLMEDELATANRQIARLRKSLASLPEIKKLLKASRSRKFELEAQVETLTSEINKLEEKLQQPPEPTHDRKEMNKEARAKLTELQAKYNELEERYLNLKLEK